MNTNDALARFDAWMALTGPRCAWLSRPGYELSMITYKGEPTSFIHTGPYLWTPAIFRRRIAQGYHTVYYHDDRVPNPSSATYEEFILWAYNHPHDAIEFTATDGECFDVYGSGTSVWRRRTYYGHVTRQRWDEVYKKGRYNLLEVNREALAELDMIHQSVSPEHNVEGHMDDPGKRFAIKFTASTENVIIEHRLDDPKHYLVHGNPETLTWDDFRSRVITNHHYLTV